MGHNTGSETLRIAVLIVARISNDSGHRKVQELWRRQSAPVQCDNKKTRSVWSTGIVICAHHSLKAWSRNELKRNESNRMGQLKTKEKMPKKRSIRSIGVSLSLDRCQKPKGRETRLRWEKRARNRSESKPTWKLKLFLSFCVRFIYDFWRLLLIWSTFFSLFLPIVPCAVTLFSNGNQRQLIGFCHLQRIMNVAE